MSGNEIVVSLEGGRGAGEWVGDGKLNLPQKLFVPKKTRKARKKSQYKKVILIKGAKNRTFRGGGAGFPGNKPEAARSDALNTFKKKICLVFLCLKK